MELQKQEKVSENLLQQIITNHHNPYSSQFSQVQEDSKKVTLIELEAEAEVCDTIIIIKVNLIEVRTFIEVFAIQKKTKDIQDKHKEVI